MQAVIYNIETGKIKKRIKGSMKVIVAQCDINSDYAINVSREFTHVINGVPVMIQPNPVPIESLLKVIREKRNLLLAACDFTMLEDSGKDKVKWKKYRQELRDFPANCDPHNPIWPTPPEGN